MPRVMPASVRNCTDEAVRYLQTLLRFDTTNPPGNETPAVEYLAGILKGEGYDPLVLESSPGRGNVVARYYGSGELPPLILYGHVDVVTAEPKHWRHDPFSGDVAEGCIWGRGALDMKGTVAQHLLSMLLLRRNRVRLRRDIIFAATADEEVGGTAGMGWLVRCHPALVQAEYGLSEGGGTTMYIAGKPFYDIRTAEKGTCRFSLQARGKPGHGSVPRTETAITHIAAAVTALAGTSLPFHSTSTSALFFEQLSEALGVARELHTLDEGNLRRVMRVLPPDLGQYVQAITHNTAVPTGLRAGHKINVIPGEAEAWIDGRYLPGQTVESFLREVRQVVGYNCAIEPLDSSRPLEEPPNNPLYRSIASVMGEHAPQASVSPIMLAGATDAKHVSTLGTHCLGFSPVRVSAGFPIEHQVHGHDERIPLDGYLWGTQVLYDIVTRFCA